MGAVLDYLMRVTQADVSKQELKQFADSIRSNPKVGMDILQGKRVSRFGREKAAQMTEKGPSSGDDVPCFCAKGRIAFHKPRAQ